MSVTIDEKKNDGFVVITLDGKPFEGDIVRSESTDDLNDSGNANFNIETKFGSGTAYLATSASILFFGKFGIGRTLANRGLGPFAQKLSLSPKFDPFILGAETAHHMEFISHVRILFELFGLEEQGKISDLDEVGDAFGRTYGIHDIGSIPVGVTALGTYGLTQSIFQNYGTNAFSYHLFDNGKIYNRFSGVPVLGKASSFMSNQVKSPFARKAWSSFLHPKSHLSRGRALTNMGMIGLGSYFGWYGMDYVKASMDPERLDLYNETPDIVRNNYQNSDFLGTLLGWTTGGAFGMGIGQGVGDNLVNFASEKMIPAGLYMYVNIPDGVVSQETLVRLAQRAEKYSEAHVKISDVIVNGLGDKSLEGLERTWESYYNAGNVAVENKLEMFSRRGFVEIVYNSDQPDTNKGHVKWMRHYRPHIEYSINDVNNSLRQSFTRIMSTARRIGGDLGDVGHYWDTLWENAKTPEQQMAVLNQMESAEYNFRNALISATEKTKSVSLKFANANSYNVHNYGSAVSINHPVLAYEDLSIRIGMRQNALDSLHARLLQLTESFPEKTFDELLTTDPSENYRLIRERLLRVRNIAEQSLRAFGVDYLPDGTKNPFNALAVRMSNLSGDIVNVDVDNSLRSYDQRVARLRANLGDFKSFDQVLDVIRDQSRLEKTSALFSEYDALNRERAGLIKSSGSIARQIDALNINREAYLFEYDQLVNVNKISESSPRALKLKAMISEIETKLQKLQHENTVEGKVVRSERPLYVQDGLGNWKSARLVDIDSRLVEIRNGLVKEGLTLESAEVVGRELRQLKRNMGGVREQVNAIVRDLKEAEKKARKSGCSEKSISRISETRMAWEGISIELSKIPDANLSLWDRFAMIFDAPKLRALKPTTVGGEKLRGARIRAGRLLSFVGKKSAKGVKYGSMMVGNVVLGALFAMGGEKAIGWYLNSQQVEEAVDMKDGYGPLFLFEDKNGGGK